MDKNIPKRFKMSKKSEKYIRNSRKDQKIEFTEKMMDLLEEVGYYPKGYGLKSSIINIPLYNFHTYPLDKVLEYLEIERFESVMDDIDKHFSITKECAEEFLNDYIEENNLFDDYYLKKYSKTRKEVIENKQQTQEDVDLEIELCTDEDEEMNFNFTKGLKGSEDNCKFLIKLANIYLQVISYGFDLFSLDNNQKEKLKNLQNYIKNKYI